MNQSARFYFEPRLDLFLRHVCQAPVDHNDSATRTGWKNRRIKRAWSVEFPDAQVVRLQDVGPYVQEEGAAELGQAARCFLDASAPAAA